MADFCGEMLDGDDEYENPTECERLTLMHHIIIIIIDLANLRHLVQQLESTFTRKPKPRDA